MLQPTGSAFLSLFGINFLSQGITKEAVNSIGESLWKEVGGEGITPVELEIKDLS